MAGEEGPSKRLSAGEICLLLKPCSTKRKAEAGDLNLRITKSKVEMAAMDQEESEKAAQIAPERKKKTRLPQEEVDQILSRAVRTRRAPRSFEALRRKNPSLIPSPEEEKDESKVAMYTVVRAYYESRESGSHAWVRGQVEKHGYVEVDDEALDLRDHLRAWSKKAREEEFETIGFSDSDN